jgi:hypothetical protein
LRLALGCGLVSAAILFFWMLWCPPKDPADKDLRYFLLGLAAAIGSICLYFWVHFEM